jgi:hypothetical protein
MGWFHCSARNKTVVCFGRYSGKYKATGVGADAQFVHVCAFRAGKVVKFQQCTDTAQFQAATGRGLAAKAP